MPETRAHDKARDAGARTVAAAHRRARAERPRAARLPDHALRGAGALAALLLLGGLAWILLDVFVQGLPELSPGFLRGEPARAGRAGGIGSLLLSTALVLGTCLAAALPVGVGAAIWLSESPRRRGPLARTARRCIDLLATVPSIVFGLFGMLFFCHTLGLGFSILAGGLTLAVMILPLVVQTTWMGLRGAPAEARAAAAALGLGPWSTLRHVLLPAASHGVLVGVLLGVGRALAETAALLFTSGYVTRWPESLLDSGRTLSVHVYDLAMNVPGGEPRAHATALVLLAALLAIHVAAQLLVRTWLREAP